MNKKFFNPLKYSVLALFFGVLLVASGCKKKPVDPDTDEDKGEDLTEEQLIIKRTNEFVIDTMRKDYLWIDDLPANSSLDFLRPVEDFYMGILSEDDRFPWIQNAKELSDQHAGIIMTSGVSVGVAWLSSQERTVIASVRYVLKGSPADLGGVKRGDLFVEVNGTRLVANASGQVPALNPLFENDAFTLSLLKLEGNTFVPDRSVTLTPVEGFAEKAILKDTIWTLPSGKKVGYLFYNRFIDNQRGEIIESLGRMKSQGIDDLVLDLRYNGGGSIRAAVVLSGLIHQGFNATSPFIRYQYNRRYRADEYNYGQLLGAEAASVSSNNLGLSKVYVIATGSSASASELVINNLKPFIGGSNVIHIGSTTYGKNVGSYQIDLDPFNDADRIEWAIQPIFVKLANADGFGDYEAGFTPLAANTMTEWDELPWVELGDVNDTYVARALTLIDPSYQAHVSKLMGPKVHTSTTLGAKEITGFTDIISKPVPVNVGEFHHQ